MNPQEANLTGNSGQEDFSPEGERSPCPVSSSEGGNPRSFLIYFVCQEDFFSTFLGSNEDISDTAMSSDSTEDKLHTAMSSELAEEEFHSTTSSDSTEDNSDTSASLDSTEDNSDTTASSDSTEDNSDTTSLDSTENNSDTATSSDSTEDNSDTAPSSDSTEDNSDTTTSSDSTEDNSDTTSSDSTEDNSDTTTSSDSTEDNSDTTTSSDSTEDNSDTTSADSTEDNSDTTTPREFEPNKLRHFMAPILKELRKRLNFGAYRRKIPFVEERMKGTRSRMILSRIDRSSLGPTFSGVRPFKLRRQMHIPISNPESLYRFGSGSLVYLNHVRGPYATYLRCPLKRSRKTPSEEETASKEAFNKEPSRYPPRI